MAELNIKEAERKGAEIAKKHHYRYDLSSISAMELAEQCGNESNNILEGLFSALCKGFYIGFYQGYKAAKREIKRGNKQ